MAIFRVIKDKENPYIMINKSYIYDSKLNLKSKGLMSYFLSRPDDWEFYQNEILNHCTDKKDSLLSAIKELEKAGYIKRELRRDKNGRLLGGYAYEIHEVPNKILNNEKTCTKTTERGLSESGENRNRKKPLSGNPPLLSNDSLLNNDSLLSNESSSRNMLEEISNYYCNRALTTEPKLKPKEIEAFIKLIQDEVPLELIKQGIDLAFKKFKPSFEGDRIKSFKYCEPVIRGLYAQDLIKMESNIAEGEEDIEIPVPYEKIKELYNSICTSLSQVRSISSTRKNHLKARWKQFKYELDTFREVFEKVEASKFCTGTNARGWKPDFDWLIKNDNNMVKVLEGKYDNKELAEGTGIKKDSFTDYEQREYDFDALEKKLLGWDKKEDGYEQ